MLHPTLVPGKDVGLCGESAEDSCRPREPVVMAVCCNRAALSCEWAPRVPFSIHTLLQTRRNLPTGRASAPSQAS